MVALPCCRRGGSEDWDGEGAEGASATGSEHCRGDGPPPGVGGGLSRRPPGQWRTCSAPPSPLTPRPAPPGGAAKHQGATEGGGCSSGGIGGAGPAVCAVPPWIQWRWRRPRALPRGCRPPMPLVGGRKDEPPPPPRPIAVAPHPLSPPGQLGGQAPGASWAWSRQAPMPRRGGYLASWVMPCTGVTPGGLSSGGPGRPGGPAAARRTMRPPLHAGPQGGAPGVLARLGAGLSDNAGPPRASVAVVACPAIAGDAPAQASAPGRHMTAPHAPSRVRPVCRRLPPAGGRIAGLRAGRFWAPPTGASWHTGARGGGARGDVGNSP